MKKNDLREKIHLTSVDELFGLENAESSIEIGIDRIRSFKDHPFKVLDDDKMADLVESIKANGVLTPVLVRGNDEDGYEMISGHRRLHASKLAGLKKIEVYDVNPNNTENNNTNINYINPILSIYTEDAMDGIDEYQAYSEIIMENIDMDSLMQRYPYEQKDVREIYELIVETVVGKGRSMTISGQQYPRELVKSRFLKLNMSHVEYVMECLRKNTTKVYNIKAYLLAALFNAGTTMSNYYRAEVNHDMPQFAG